MALCECRICNYGENELSASGWGWDGRTGSKMVSLKTKKGMRKKRTDSFVILYF